MKIAISIFLVSMSISLVTGQSCADMPPHFNSYESAIVFVRNASFKLSDKVNTSKSSWITSASYYSCDGKSGFFIFGTKTREYIHANVPVELWINFKKAESFGAFYDHNIKKKYGFHL